MIELVVAIGIIAVGVGILTPMIQTARTQSGITTCVSNLQVIGEATTNYAADYFGALPPWREESYNYFRDAGGAILNFGSTWEVDYIVAVPTLSGTATDFGSNLFRLQILGYLGNWNWTVQGHAVPHTHIVMRNGAAAAVNGIKNVFVQNDTTYFPTRWCPGQNGKLSNFGASYGSDYMYNPHWAYLNYSSWKTSAHFQPVFPGSDETNGPTTGWYTKLSQYPSNVVLACDNVYDVPSLNHVISTNTSASFNMLYADGHVASVTDTYVESGFNKSQSLAPFGGAQGTIAVASSPCSGVAVTGNVAGATNQFWLMDDYLDILETEADGRNPMKQDLYTGGIPRTSSRGNVLPLQFREQFIKGWDSGDPTSNSGNLLIVNTF